MAAGPWTIYDKFPLYLGDGTIDMDADTFHVALYTSASNAGTLTNDNLVDLTNEVSGFGYARDTANTVSWSESAGVVTFDITTDPQFTASGGSITARFAVIIDDTPVSPADPLVCNALLDSAPADVTVTDGNTLTLQIASAGVFSIS